MDTKQVGLRSKKSLPYLVPFGETKSLADSKEALWIRYNVLLGLLDGAIRPFAYVSLVLKTPSWRPASNALVRKCGLVVTQALFAPTHGLAGVQSSKSVQATATSHKQV